jgi:hypothetical protein
VLEAFPQSVLYLFVARAGPAASGLLAQVLLHLTGQARRLIVEPVHELPRPELLSQPMQIEPAGGERSRGIGDAGRAQLEEIRGEGPLEAQPRGLRGIQGDDPFQRV